MVLDRPAAPVVLAPGVRRHSHLGSEELDRRRRHLAGVAREAPLQLEELHEGGEAEACRAALVAERLAFRPRQAPVFDELVRSPLPLHGGLLDGETAGADSTAGGQFPRAAISRN